MTTSRSSAAKPPRERQVYRETYDRKLTTTRDPKKLPTVPGLKLEGLPDPVVVEMQVLAAGVVERGSERLEYHDIRVYVRAP